MRNLLIVPLIFSLGCSSFYGNHTGDNGSMREPSGSFGNNSLAGAPVEKYASAANLKLSSGELIMDNDLAFAAKMDLIHKAQAGDTLRIAYYIYSDDESASVFTRALIAKAQSGVKIKLLLDLLQNYARLDLFKAMERESGGNIEVKFYGRPTRNIVMDAAYMAGHCTGDVSKCQDELIKQIDPVFAADSEAQVQANISLSNTGSSGLILSGVYGKNPDVIAMSIMNAKGQVINNIKASSNDKPLTAEDKAGLQKLGKLYWRAMTDDAFSQLSARIQLGLARILYPDKVEPVIDTIDSFIPISVKKSTEYKRSKEKAGSVRAEDWVHITDYTHHKIILLNDSELVMGGRNIENSYHMQPNAMTPKYIFRDTDFHAVISSNGNKVAESFDRLYNFKPLTISTREIDQLMPNDIVGNLRLAAEECTTSGLAKKIDVYKAQGNKAAVKNLKEKLIAPCTKSIFADKEQRSALLQQLQAANSELKALPQMRSSSDRQKIVLESMGTKATLYANNYSDFPNDNDVIALSDEDLKASFHYLENLHFKKEAAQTRIYGTERGQSADYGKQIHEAWVDGLVKTCQVATVKEPKKVVLHSAYFFLPSNLLRTLAKMVDGTIPCGNVKVTIITNSEHSTDLVPVNVYNMNTMKTLFDYANYVKNVDIKDKDKRKIKIDASQVASLEFYEYDKAALTRLAGGNGSFSLHTKLSVLGDDIIIGSANADVRSYAMDTNNAMFIVGATGLVQKYWDWIESLKKQNLISEVSQRFNKSYDAIFNEQKNILQAMKHKYMGEDSESIFVSDENMQKYIDRLQATLQTLNTYSKDIVKRRELIMKSNDLSAQASAPDSLNVPKKNPALTARMKSKMDILNYPGRNLKDQEINSRLDKAAEEFIEEEVMSNYDYFFQPI